MFLLISVQYYHINIFHLCNMLNLKIPLNFAVKSFSREEFPLRLETISLNRHFISLSTITVQLLAN